MAIKISSKLIKLVVVIPTYNRKSYLENLLKQLTAQEVNDCDTEIIIVVEGSTDGSLVMLQTWFPKVHIVIGNGN